MQRLRTKRLLSCRHLGGPGRSQSIVSAGSLLGGATHKHHTELLGKQHGRGVYLTANGDRYEGDFRDGYFSGSGFFAFTNGDRCEGEFREDRLLGFGKGRKNGLSVKCYMDGTTIEFTD